MDWQTITLVLGLGAMLIGPGYWLYRDTQRHGSNSIAWVTAYAVAAAPPTRLRFIFAALVFAAWFLWRGRHTLFPKWVTRLFTGDRRKSRGRSR